MNPLLRRARRRRRGSPGVELLIIQGGLRPRTQDGNPAHAEVGGMRLQRAADEPFDQFCERVLAAAQISGDPRPIIGGLPPDAIGDDNELLEFEWADEPRPPDLEDDAPLPPDPP
jgi:hypothetical protein